MAQPAPATQQPAPWQSPNARSNKGPALEPIDLPPAIEQGVDMIYVDQDLVPRAVQNSSLLHDISFELLDGRAGRPLRFGEPDLHGPAPRVGKISAALG